MRAKSKRRRAPADPIRAHLAKALAWHEAHAGLDAAVANLSPGLHGRRPAGFPHSPWELVEHIRLAQADILDFCRNSAYKERAWPADYWPKSPKPPSATAWARSLAALRRDRAALQKLAEDTTVGLTARIPHGTGQTYLREILLVMDHTSYHVGELVAARLSLGAWPKG